MIRGAMRLRPGGALALALVASSGCDLGTGGEAEPGYQVVLARYVEDPGGFQPALDLFLVDPFSPGTGTRLTETPGIDETDPAWSPDGRRIAFSRRGGDAYTRLEEVWVMGADGSGATRLTQWPAAGAPTWSPDGGRIAYAQNGDLFVADARGGEPVRLWVNRQYAGGPAWSPDGGRIAFHAGLTPTLHTARPDGGDVALLAPDLPFAYAPAWSPDGRWIAYVGADADGDGVFVVSAEGGARRRVTPPAGYIPGGPAWSPDGRWIGFVAWTEDAGSEAMVLPADGSKPPRTLGRAGGSRIAWRP